MLFIVLVLKLASFLNKGSFVLFETEAKHCAGKSGEIIETMRLVGKYYFLTFSSEKSSDTWIA